MNLFSICQRSFDASFQCRICTIFVFALIRAGHNLNLLIFLTLFYLVLFSFDFGVIGFCPYYVLIMSYFYAGYYLFPIFTCSFFQLVPFYIACSFFCLQREQPSLFTWSFSLDPFSLFIYRHIQQAATRLFGLPLVKCIV